MPRSKKSHPILRKAMAFLALPLAPMAKAKSRIARKLLVLKNGKRSYKQFRHYSYAYVGEYQFSPSASPLIRYPPGAAAWRSGSRKRRGRPCFALATLLCGGSGGGGDGIGDSVLEGLPRAVEEWVGDGEGDGTGEEEEEDVDRRAERFIERFYEEMRLQRQRSLVQIL